MKRNIAIVAVAAILLFVLGFRVGHPVSGLTSAMGSAKSSIVVYKKSGDYSQGNKVVVEVAGQGIESGIVKSSTKETVDVDTVSAFVRVNKPDVKGKLIVVVPFFGTILNLVGL